MGHVTPGRWIWIPEWDSIDDKRAQLVYFRKLFSVSRKQLEQKQSCMVRISADTRYKFYVNGILVAFGPMKGDDKCWYYDLIDIKAFIKEDVNVIAVEVLHYPTGYGKGNHSLYRTDQPGLYFEEVTENTKEPILQTWTEIQEDADCPTSGGRLGISADLTWDCHLVENYRIVPETDGFAPLMIQEDCAGNVYMNGWKGCEYEPQQGEWKPVAVYHVYMMNRARVPGDLQKRSIPFMNLIQRQFTAVQELREGICSVEDWEYMLKQEGCITIPAYSKEVVEITSGELQCGFLKLSVACGAGTRIYILCSEAYCTDINIMPDGQVIPVKADRCDSKNGKLSGHTDIYCVAGFGTKKRPEIYEPFWFRTFRFIKLIVETTDEPLTITRFDYKATGYPLEVHAKVKTSDSTLEAVWDISLRTLKRCMHETYIDCPFYEQLQYLMDSRSQILYTYCVSGDDRLARQCMEAFRRSQRYDGLLNCSYPNYEVNVIPGFSIYYILMIYDHMMYFGDKEFLRKHLGCIDGILHFFEGHIDGKGLVERIGGIIMESRYWGFVDWALQWNSTSGVPRAVLFGSVTMDSLLYVMGLQAASEILSYMGRKDTAKEYIYRAESVRRAIQEHCIDDEGMIMDGPECPDVSQQAQVFAVLTETVSQETGRKLLERTLDAPEQYAQCSVAMAYYLFRALEKTQLYERTDQLWDLWRNMVKNNLSTCVEDGVTGRSDCHAWGALALFELPSVILGVRPAAPGYEKIKIRPVTAKLTSAVGDAVTKHGIVHVEWFKDKNGLLQISYQVPDGVEVIQ